MRQEPDRQRREGWVRPSRHISEFFLDWAHFAEPGIVELMVEVSGRPEVVFVRLRRSLFDRKRPTVVEVARREALVIAATVFYLMPFFVLVLINVKTLLYLGP